MDWEYQSDGYLKRLHVSESLAAIQQAGFRFCLESFYTCKMISRNQ